MSKKKNYSIKLFDTMEEYTKYVNEKGGVSFKVDVMEMVGQSQELTVTYAPQENKVVGGVQYYAYLILETEQYRYLTMLLESGNVYKDITELYEYDEEDDDMINLTPQFMGFDAGIDFYPNEDGSFIIRQMAKIGVTRNSEYDEDGFAYIASLDGVSMIFIADVEYTETGTFEQQHLYAKLGSPFGSRDINADVYVTEGGYVEPHVSVCKDTMKLNYNLGSNENIVTIRWTEGHWSDPSYCEVIFTINGMGYIVTDESPAYVEYYPDMEITSTAYSDCRFRIVDQDDNDIVTYDWGDSLPISFVVPKGTRELILYGIPG